eukprot:1522611-Amphidinium_carterae.1
MLFLTPYFSNRCTGMFARIHSFYTIGGVSCGVKCMFSNTGLLCWLVGMQGFGHVVLLLSRSPAQVIHEQVLRDLSKGDYRCKNTAYPLHQCRKMKLLSHAKHLHARACLCRSQVEKSSKFYEASSAAALEASFQTPSLSQDPTQNT